MHIVFGASSVTALSAAFELDNSLQSEILCFEDDLSVGPLFILDTRDGQQARQQWWDQVNDVTPPPVPVEHPNLSPVPAGLTPLADLPQDVLLFKELKALLKADPELQLFIWAGQNARDVSGYFWLVNQLYDFAGRVQIIYLNNLPFLNEKGNLFYPTHLSQILPKEFVKAKKLARPVSLAEFELDGDEWKRLMNENAGVRLLEGGKKLKGETVSFYDKDLVAIVGKESMKANKVVSQLISKLKYPVAEAFLVWRLKELVKQGILESKGEFKSLKDFEVQVPGAVTSAPENAEV
ncbi:Protein of unknown function [Chitinophaga costaii]|uniref:DUF1835 domain-containing protein n=1 Tax=Chitinophaga costaii TaxID=1335309 RepID=A0A1C4CHM2_9BACT|nr:DUF1835 domain-containing protein [Chitinophaga costaii]PUZ27089.1 DUF1835 domain-containing protein [Chitinophaga costaii]SCC18554.1 Protein of unknown function [Chitinophaga costaii]